MLQFSCLLKVYYMFRFSILIRQQSSVIRSTNRNKKHQENNTAIFNLQVAIALSNIRLNMQVL